MDTYDSIDSILEERHLSRRKLAQAIGLPPSTFQSMMSRKSGMTLEVLMKIVSYLQVSPDAFWKGLGKDAVLAYDAGFDDGSKMEERQNYVIDELWKRDGYTGSDIETRLITAFASLNPAGQEKAVERVEELTEVERYQKEKNPAEGG